MKANYSAAIVYHHLDEELVPMAMRGNNLHLIPSVFVGHSDAVSLLAQFTFQTGDRRYAARLTHHASSDSKAYKLPVRYY